MEVTTTKNEKKNGPWKIFFQTLKVFIKNCWILFSFPSSFSFLFLSFFFSPISNKPICIWQKNQNFRCVSLDENQTFGPGIAHLQIESTGPIRLGPLAFKSRGLQQLESVTFVDTPILELDKTAFEGVPYLFAVNFTRNNLEDIPMDIFVNNSQLSLITISGNPMKRFQTAVKAKTRDYLLNAPSISELDFSDNSISRLPHTAFIKMPNLVFINLKKNRLKTIDRAHFNSLESLTELDLSYNELQEIPVDLFEGNAKNVQILRVVGEISFVFYSHDKVLSSSRDRLRFRIQN